jgi:hypothetical protein
MVRSASSRVSNHETTGKATKIRTNLENASAASPLLTLLLGITVDHGGNQASHHDFYVFCSEPIHALSARLQRRELAHAMAIDRLQNR